MSSTPTPSFDEHDLERLEWIFDAVCDTLEANAYFQHARKDKELMQALRRQLFAMANHGKIDEEKFRSSLLAGVPLAA